MLAACRHLINKYTPYGEKISRTHPLAEYPRPQMERDSYQNLNGRWEYALTKGKEPPRECDGEIIVPFSPESVLSGVGRVVTPEDTLWYRRWFHLEPGFNRGRVLLHFGGVDQCCTLWLNGREVGGHDGAYIPFYHDITPYLSEGENELMLAVIDECDTAPYARGRQRMEHGGHWHTSMSGIWQTVWIESVPQNYIENLFIVPQFDENAVDILAKTAGGELTGEVELFAGKTRVTKSNLRSGEIVRLSIPNPLSWTPRKPFLYTVTVTAGEDKVSGYFGMRKFSVGRDGAGRPRIFLNNKPFLVKGIIDQGMYSDGLYTPPSDAAMKNDIKYARACGFNMIRKHGKIEPLRWYYHCDRLGMLVWQDLPDGGDMVKKITPRLFEKQVRDGNYRRFGRESKEGRLSFVRDMQRVVRLLYNSPALMCWVLFNDGWGQFDAANLAAKVKTLDPGRLVDHASGRFDQLAGDIRSIHCPGARPKLPGQMDGRVAALTESGGFGWLDEAHFEGRTPLSAQRMPSQRELEAALEDLWKGGLAPLVEEGLSAFAYLQLSDAEDEVSGLLTADRRVEKVPSKVLRRLNDFLKG